MSKKINTLLSFAIHIVEHCNLNCISCAHISPVAKECFYDLNEYITEAKCLSSLFCSEIGELLLMGGEPLLHPDIIEFMRVSREAFIYGNILLVTNGILLDSMKQDFWDACRKYDITISRSMC